MSDTQHMRLTLRDHLCFISGAGGIGFIAAMHIIATMPRMHQHGLFNVLVLLPGIIVASQIVIYARRLSWLVRGLLVVATVFLTVCWGLFISVALADILFIGMSIADWGVILIGGVFAVALTDALYLYIKHMGRREVLIIGLAALFSGLMMSMITVSRPEWWRDSLSFMGQDKASGWWFNMTMILVGMCLLAYAHLLMSAIRQLKPRPLKLINVGLLALPVGVIGIGIFPMRVSAISQTMHDAFAILMVVSFTFLALRLPAVISFLRRSHVAAVAVAAALLSFYAGITNYVFMEFALIAILILWIDRLDRAISYEERLRQTRSESSRP